MAPRSAMTIGGTSDKRKDMFDVTLPLMLILFCHAALGAILPERACDAAMPFFVRRPLSASHDAAAIPREARLPPPPTLICCYA